jgi:hypothetical protein
MIIGTSYFPSYKQACLYYSSQGISEEGVTLKIDSKEIYIGKPALRNEKEEILLVNENPGKRFYIKIPF